jgi:hypothetical protein
MGCVEKEFLNFSKIKTKAVQALVFAILNVSLIKMSERRGSFKAGPTRFPFKKMYKELFIRNLVAALEVSAVLDPDPIDNFVAIGEFMADGGDLNNILLVHGEGCACVKCDLHKKLMEVARILGDVHKQTRDDMPADSDGREPCPDDCRAPCCWGKMNWDHVVGEEEEISADEGKE